MDWTHIYYWPVTDHKSRTSFYWYVGPALDHCPFYALPYPALPCPPANRRLIWLFDCQIDVLFRTLSKRPTAAAATATAPTTTTTASPQKQKKPTPSKSQRSEQSAESAAAAAALRAAGMQRNREAAEDLAFLTNQREERAKAEASDDAKQNAAAAAGASTAERRAERLATEVSRAAEERLNDQKRAYELNARAHMTDEERAAYDRAVHTQKRLARREAERHAAEAEAAEAAERHASATAAHKHKHRSADGESKSEVPILRKTQYELDALKAIAHSAERKRARNLPLTTASSGGGAAPEASLLHTSALLHHSNELLAAARRREDKQLFKNLQRVMDHGNQKRLVINREKSKVSRFGSCLGRLCVVDRMSCSTDSVSIMCCKTHKTVGAGA